MTKVSDIIFTFGTQYNKIVGDKMKNMIRNRIREGVVNYLTLLTPGFASEPGN